MRVQRTWGAIGFRGVQRNSTPFPFSDTKSDLLTHSQPYDGSVMLLIVPFSRPIIKELQRFGGWFCQDATL